MQWTCYEFWKVLHAKRITARPGKENAPSTSPKTRAEVAGAVVGEECGTVAERHLRHARLLHRVLENLDQRARGHVRLQAPGQDEAAVVVEDGDQVVVAPAGYLEVGAVAGPHLVGAR